MNWTCLIIADLVLGIWFFAILWTMFHEDNKNFPWITAILAIALWPLYVTFFLLRAGWRRIRRK